MRKALVFGMLLAVIGFLVATVIHVPIVGPLRPFLPWMTAAFCFVVPPLYVWANQFQRNR